MSSAYERQLQRIAEAYYEAGEPWPASSRAIVQWGREHDMLALREADILGKLADDMSRALRQEYFIDPQGRNVRAKHCARMKVNGEQQALWDDLRTADRDFMHVSTQQRRQQIVGDCRQLKRDVDSFNENHNFGDPIKMVFDFTYDVAEGD